MKIIGMRVLTDNQILYLRQLGFLVRYLSKWYTGEDRPRITNTHKCVSLCEISVS